MKKLILASLMLSISAFSFAEINYHQPVEIIQNDGEELVFKVNKGILQEDEGTKSKDFILYYNVEFNKDLDALPRKEKKEYLNQMRHNFTIGDSCRDMADSQECIAAIEKYTINLEAGEGWRTVRLPIEKRGKYTIHFYREGIEGKKINDKVVEQLAKDGDQIAKGDSKISKFLEKSVSFFKGKSADGQRDVAFYPIWKQEIYVEPKKETSQEEIDRIAQMYAPISFMHSEEEYLPTSLEYMANEVDKDPALDEEIFQLTLDPVLKGKGLELRRGRTVEFPYKDLKKVLPYNSDSLMVLSSTLGKKKTRLRYRTGTPEDATVYYSFMENKELNQAYLNYHFLFPFDPKTGSAEKPALPAHSFDRESMTIVLDLDTLQPNFVVYGAHLPNQLMGIVGKIIDPNAAKGAIAWIKGIFSSKEESKKELEIIKLQTWLGGRVTLDWDEVNKVKDKHPIIVMAQGSHGIYPAKGDYVVAMDFGAEIDTLVEGANGEQILYPNTLEVSKRGQKSSTFKNYKRITSYQVRNLDLGNITSTSWNSILAFSGDTVDVLGPMNAKFPPYTGREFDTASYVNGDKCSEKSDTCQPDAAGVLREAVYKWDPEKVQSKQKRNMVRERKLLNKYFQYN